MKLNFKRRTWSDSEDLLMRENYRTVGSRGMLKILPPDRTQKAIEQRAVTLELTKVRGDAWGPTEDERLARLWLTMGVACIAEFPGRSKTSLQARARTLRLRSELARKPRPKPAPKVSEEGVRRVCFGEEIVETSSDTRKGRSVYGKLPGGPVRSVFELGGGT